jgi:hypothetical protein
MKKVRSRWTTVFYVAATLLALASLAGCSDAPAAEVPAVEAPAEPPPCAPGMVAMEAGGCRPAGLPPDMPCHDRFRRRP